MNTCTIGEKMKEEREIPDSSFTSAMTLTQMGVPNVPSHYVLPRSQRPKPGIILHPSTTLPIIDLSSLNNPSLRSQTIDQVHIACKDLGFFQVLLYEYLFHVLLIYHANIKYIFFQRLTRNMHKCPFGFRYIIFPLC